MSETKTMSSTKTTSTEQVRFLTVTAIGIALVYVFTWLINIRLPFAPQGGLIHLGNVPLFIFAILFGKKTGAIAGGVGMGLFDLLSGWTAWAPFTFAIVGCMGFVMGWITEKKQVTSSPIFSKLHTAARTIRSKPIGYRTCAAVFLDRSLPVVSKPIR